jgi:hypothetical protein
MDGFVQEVDEAALEREQLDVDGSEEFLEDYFLLLDEEEDEEEGNVEEESNKATLLN